MNQVLLKFYILPGPQEFVYLSQTNPLLHNGKVWFCFDPPTCQKVVYWSTSGTHANKWVYSLNGLNGTNIIGWLNKNSLFPVDDQNTSWEGVVGSQTITSSSFTAILDLPDQSSQCIDSDFVNCFNNLASYFSSSQMITLIDYGFAEEGSTEQLSGLCRIKNILLQLKPNFTPTDVFNYMEVLLNKGLVISKNSQNCQGLIGSIDFFLNNLPTTTTTTIAP